VDFARSYVGSIGANEDVENTIENFPQRGARKAIQICKSVNLKAVKQKKSKKMEVRLALKRKQFTYSIVRLFYGTIRQTVPHKVCNKNKKERVNFSTSLSFRPTER